MWKPTREEIVAGVAIVVEHLIEAKLVTREGDDLILTPRYLALADSGLNFHEIIELTEKEH